MYDEEDLLPLSGLQHLSFCARQWGLIHLEGIWAENRLTVEGKQLHERADAPGVEVRGDLRIVRGLRIQSLRLGLAGIADVVEFHRVADAPAGVGTAVGAGDLSQLNPSPGEGAPLAQGARLPGARGLWRPVPVEYKRGRAKKGNCDAVQLCAQALCLEEMLGVAVPEGALFYGQTKRRLVVRMDAALRAETAALAARMLALAAAGQTPPPEPGPKCAACSLVETCKPEALAGSGRAGRYVARLLRKLEQGGGRMKRLLNTLYVTTPGAYLSRDGETVTVKIEDEIRLRVPIHTLGGIVCIGNTACSTPLMGLCSERGVGLAFFTDNGRFLARVQGGVSGNVLLRRAQYRSADDAAATADLARAMVAGKIANGRTVLMRAARDRAAGPEADALGEAAARMARSAGPLSSAAHVDSVRGVEGDAARIYFGVFDHLITVQKPDFFFRTRSRRPPLDNMNALLSFLYVLLLHDTVSACEGVGLDPAVGFLHRDRPGRPGLALDLIEELRPVLADRVALSLVNRQQVKPGGFTQTASGGVQMDDATRKTVLIAYQERKREEITHPFLEEKVELGLLPHLQALLMARRLRGDLDAYPPFLWK